MKVYQRTASGNCHKVRLCLSALGLDYEAVDLVLEQQQEPWFLQLSPAGQIPVLEDQGAAISDSLAIMVYLAEQHDHQAKWLPKEGVAKAKVLSWMGYANSTIHLGLTRLYGADFFHRPLDRADAEVVALKTLALLEQTLSQSAWLCGSEPSLADLAVYPYVERLSLTQLSTAKYPSLEAWVGGIKKAPWYVQ